jgi:phosphatidylserine/phosphatidylglycerophosphate/cardiolipin synthase-like enzyme
MLEALTAAADRLRGGVYVITQLDEARLRKGLAELDGEDNLDVQAQKKRFDEMTRQGLYVRGHPNCHAKFAVVDDEIALVTTANLMTSALDHTGEAGVVITDRAEVGRLARLYARLWQTGCRWEAYPGEAYAVRGRTPQPWITPIPRHQITPVPGVIWTDGVEHDILHTIRDVLTRAETELLLATFSLSGIRRRPEILLDEINRTLARGVRVRLLLRPRRHIPDHRADAEALAEAGAEIYADLRTHVKLAIADRRHGAIFSANFDTQRGLTSGVEVGCRLDGTPALAETVRYIEHAIDQAELKMAVNPSHHELNMALDAPWHAQWPLADDLPVTAAETLWTQFRQAADAGPVLFTLETDSRITLHTQGGSWTLTGKPESYRLEPDGRQSNPRTAGPRLAAWLETHDGTPKRGICAARIHRAEPVAGTDHRHEDSI